MKNVSGVTSPRLYFGPIGKAVQAGNMQIGEARMDRKQTASPVAVNEVEVEVDVEVVEANAVGPAAGILLRAFSWVTL